MEYELLIREAEVEDAAELVAFLNRVSVENRFYQFWIGMAF